jgi:hypothetical protein
VKVGQEAGRWRGFTHDGDEPVETSGNDETEKSGLGGPSGVTK